MSETRSEFVEANGLRFHVNACGDDTSPRLALCLHGFPELGYSWREQLPRFGRLDWESPGAARASPRARCVPNYSKPRANS